MRKVSESLPWRQLARGMLRLPAASAVALTVVLVPADPAGAATIIVDDTGDAYAADGKCTLREAIESSDDNAQVPAAIAGDCAAGEDGPAVRDEIEFEFAGPFPKTIKPASNLPLITDQVEIDGRVGTENAIRIEIDGSLVPSTGFPEEGLFVTTGSDGSYLHHLAVFGFPDNGINLFTDENTVERVILGMNQEGVAADGNGGAGMLIRGNRNTVEKSVISGNVASGISLFPVSVGTGAETAIVGNRIGTNKAGGAAVPNGEAGISVQLSTVFPEGAPADDITIGGASTPGGECDGDCNLISGNDESGVIVVVNGPEPGRADGLVIEGNYLGTDVSGMEAIPNSPAISAGAVTIAGATDGAAVRDNLISGNGADGISLFAGASSDIGPTATAIAGNTIGLAVDGTTPLPNDDHGIRMDRSLIGGPPMAGTAIGGTTDPTPEGACDGDCNLISGNGQSGITIFDTTFEGGPIADTRILGNYIGTDVSGTLDRGNGAWGIQLSGVSDTTVGQPGSPNVISGNDLSGLVFLGGSTTGNTAQSNLVGVAADGSSPLGNSKHGIEAGFGAASQNTIGGIGTGLGNVIAHNGDAGVMLGGSEEPVVDMPVLGNSISSNGGLGIDLRPDLLTGGVTENGACNELEVANRCQEFPALTAAVGGSAVAAGMLDSDPGRAFRIEVFANSAADPSGNGEGERFLGAVEATTDGSGHATWLFADPAGALADGESVSATATELGGGGTPLSTSEFSDDLATPVCQLSGDGGANTLNGGEGSEVICGFGANDSLNGGGGRDALLGGDGDDSIEAADGQSDALIDCGPGNDAVTADAAAIDADAVFVGCEQIARPVVVPAASRAKCGGKQATIVGNGGADKLNGTKKRDVIAGLGGKDRIKGLGGNDLLCGGAGDDTILGNGGADKLYGGSGKDVLKGGGGKDLLKGEAAKDLLKGEAAKDTLNAGQGSGERCDGGAGRDAGKAPGCEKRQRLP
jgi:Ca2+-binding RTX toxin-like protein